MRSDDLQCLNFRDLIDLPKQLRREIPVKHSYCTARECKSFCIDCEQKKLCSPPLRPYRMSHGADTQDIEEAFGRPLPSSPDGKVLTIPVAFLGIEPGGGSDGEAALPHPDYPHIRKGIPTQHYYWTPNPEPHWPTKPDDVTWVPGPLLAYLLYRFQFRNAYFTNIVKCRLRKGDSDVNIKPDIRHKLDYSKVRINCVERFLKRELELHRPKIIFVFGNDGKKILSDVKWLDQSVIVKLRHYAVVNRNLTKRPEYIEEVETDVEKGLRQLGAM